MILLNHDHDDDKILDFDDHDDDDKIYWIYVQPQTSLALVNISVGEFTKLLVNHSATLLR